MKSLSSPHLHRFAGALLVGTMLLSLSGCDDDFVGGTEPEKKFEGIRVTFEDGRQGGSIGDASDDWRSIPQVGLTVIPAAPNPVTIASDELGVPTRTSIEFRLAQAESLRLWVESSPGVPDMELLVGTMEAGNHVLEADFTGKQPGIYRVYLSIRREGADYTTYGDLMLRLPK